MQRTVHHRNRIGECQPTLRCARRAAEFLHELRQAIGFQFNLGQELAPRVRIPVDVRSAQTGDESLDMAERQPQLVRDRGQSLLVRALSEADSHHIIPSLLIYAFKRALTLAWVYINWGALVCSGVLWWACLAHHRFR